MNRGKKVVFGSRLVRKVSDSLRNLGRNKLILHRLKKASEIALKVARKHLEGVGGKHNIRTPQVISIPKVGVILPLIPIFAGMSAIVSLTCPAAGIIKAVQTAKASIMHLEEALRQNKQMEAIALVKSGIGLYVKPFRKRLGIYQESKNY